MFNDIFELLTTASDVSQFISLYQAFQHKDRLEIMARLDQQDDEMFSKTLKYQEYIIELLTKIAEKVGVEDVRALTDSVLSGNRKLEPLKSNNSTLKENESEPQQDNNNKDIQPVKSANNKKPLLDDIPKEKPETVRSNLMVSGKNVFKL